jgi:hypothetical protein
MTINKLNIVRSAESMSLDVDTGDFMARLTIWLRDNNHGLCDSEILNVNTEERVMWKHDEYHNHEQVHAIVQHFWQELNKWDTNSPIPTNLMEVPIDASEMLQPLLTR